MIKELTLVKIGSLNEAILRAKAAPVKKEAIKSKEIQGICDALKYYVIVHGGVGLASPQMGVSTRIFVMYFNPEDFPEYPEYTVVIDPKFIKISEKIVKDFEGCLSVPGYRGIVPRHEEIEVEYYNEKGKKVHITYDGFIAIVFQHEYDHLEGILYKDRIENPEEYITDEEFEEWKKEQKKGHHKVAASEETEI